VLAPLIIAAVTFGTITAAAEATPPAAQEAVAATSGGTPGAWQLGTFEIAGLAGYASGTVTDPERTATSFGQVLVRFALHFGPTGGGAMRGNFAIVAEGVGMWIDQQPNASGGGLNLLIRYAWAAGRWRPVFLAGAGIYYSDVPVPPGETTRNFTPQAGVGLRYLFTDRLALGGEYRFHHLSNKGATETNPGINSHLVLFGFSWFH